MQVHVTVITIFVRFWFKFFNDELEKCAHTYKNVIKCN